MHKASDIARKAQAKAKAKQREEANSQRSLPQAKWSCKRYILLMQLFHLVLGKEGRRHKEKLEVVV